jgi:hypothetical protein
MFRQDNWRLTRLNYRVTNDFFPPFTSSLCYHFKSLPAKARCRPHLSCQFFSSILPCFHHPIVIHQMYSLSLLSFSVDSDTIGPAPTNYISHPLTYFITVSVTFYQTYHEIFTITLPSYFSSLLPTYITTASHFLSFGIMSFFSFHIVSFLFFSFALSTVFRSFIDQFWQCT